MIMSLNSNDEWYTPPYVIALAREVLGCIDLDPASNVVAQSNVHATKFFTKEDNGLKHDWLGKVWCNPPYSASLIKQFTQKFADEFIKGNMTEGIILTNSGTDTIWNQPLIIGMQAYTLGRISFLQPDGSEKGKGGRGQCFTYLGDNPRKFIDVFTRDDFCWVPNILGV